MNTHQAPFMIETAYYYLRAAKILWRERNNMQQVSLINAAIGIEILLKSFQSTPIDNANVGTIAENYNFPIKAKPYEKHNLKFLAQGIDSYLYKKLNIKIHENTLERYDNYFVASRYSYESTAMASYDSSLIDAGIEILQKTISWYKETKSSDPWIFNYPNIPGGEI